MCDLRQHSSGQKHENWFSSGQIFFSLRNRKSRLAMRRLPHGCTISPQQFSRSENFLHAFFLANTSLFLVASEQAIVLIFKLKLKCTLLPSMPTNSRCQRDAAKKEKRIQSDSVQKVEMCIYKSQALIASSPTKTCSVQ